MRMQLIETHAADRRVRAVRVEVRGFNLRDLAPGDQAGRRNVAPVLAAVARDPDQAVIGAGPQQVVILG